MRSLGAFSLPFKPPGVVTSWLGSPLFSSCNVDHIHRDSGRCHRRHTAPRRARCRRARSARVFELILSLFRFHYRCMRVWRWRCARAAAAFWLPYLAVAYISHLMSGVLCAFCILYRASTATKQATRKTATCLTWAHGDFSFYCVQRARITHQNDVALPVSGRPGPA